MLAGEDARTACKVSSVLQTLALPLSFLLLLWVVPALAALDEILDEPPMVTAESWLMIDSGSGRVIVSKNADTIAPIASLSKVMAAVVVMDYLASAEAELDVNLVVSKMAASVAGTSARLETGDRVSVRNMLFGLLLPSGNDAATALAEYVGRRLPGGKGASATGNFIRHMNKTATVLGMQDTTFDDVHGMGENFSTPRDLMMLSRYAMQNSLFREIVGTKTWQVIVRSNRGSERELTWRNTNRLLDTFTGIKTGHTFVAGGCLILSGTYQGKELHLVVLGSDNKKTRFIDGYNLFQWGVYQLSLDVLGE